ncbi:MAG TPA: DMT family transporter [Cytophagaceae bacterium]|jgi:drug/metabolite transporter (DMT)-like permease|nr:DMT family transporter [Cytophagaceae bacterium]
MSKSIETEKNKERQFFIGMLVSMFCWGLSWASGKVLSGYGETTSVATLRLSITFIALFAVLFFLKEKMLVKVNGWLPLTGAAVLMTLYNYLFFEGLAHGKAGAGGVLVTTLNPIISYAIMLLFTLRKPTKNETIGLFIGILAGAVLLKIWDDWKSILASGNMYFVLATITWAILSLFTARSSRYGSPIAYSLWMYACCSVLMLTFTSIDANIKLCRSSDTTFWLNMLFSAVVTTAFATTFYFVATARLGASKASSFIFLVPFSAAMGSWIFLKEEPQTHTIFGGLLGIIAVYVINKKSQSTEN